MAQAVLKVARDMDVERRRSEIESIGISTANALAKLLKKRK